MEPLVPIDVDLRSFDFMPLKVLQLRDSDIATLASGDEFRAAVLLWCAAWHEVPASSLPDDDRLLARAAGYGRDMKGWLRVKEMALHGFVTCSDGRLYHPVIADLAIDAFKKKIKFTNKTKNATEARRKKFAHRDEQRDDKPKPPDDDVTNNVTISSTLSKGTVEGEYESKKVPPPSQKQRDDECAEAVAAYNAVAQDRLLPICQRLTEPRKRALLARFDECGGLPGWLVAMEKLKASPFLTGDNDKNWRADFDFLIQAKSFTKLMEGSYARRNGTSGTQSRRDSWEQAEAILDERDRRASTTGDSSESGEADIFVLPGLRQGSS